MPLKLASGQNYPPLSRFANFQVMVYRVIGLMSGSSLDGLDVAFVHVDDSGGKWSYQLVHTDCIAYDDVLLARLKNATQLSAYDYAVLHADYGRWMGEQINAFIEKHGLWHQVQLIASHGHTTFHVPASGVTGQIGCGATLAAVTGINVVSDLRVMDVALGGQGAPIVPIGEKLLLGDYRYFLNLGGIANISVNADTYLAYDVTAANRVLNMLVAPSGAAYDAGGAIAATGKVDTPTLTQLNAQAFFKQSAPKSLANDFGTDVLYPIVANAGLSMADALCTFTEHIAMQIGYAVAAHYKGEPYGKMMICGGGAFNTYLVERIQHYVKACNITVEVPDSQLVAYKEALVMALLGVLRWREENTVLHSVTGATRSSIGGAVWIGQEA